MSNGSFEANVPGFGTISGYIELEGLTQPSRRDQFAMAALTGLCANPAFAAMIDDDMAESARDLADALIAELDKGDG